MRIFTMILRKMSVKMISPIHKLVAITTDGAPAMHAVRTWFIIALCCNDPDFPDSVNYHCDSSAGRRLLSCNDTGGQTDQLDSSKSTSALLFKLLLDELDAAYKNLLLHTDVWWLSHRKVLQRFVDVLPEIKTFLSTRNEEHKELLDNVWLLDLGFLTDLTAKLNALNNELQGKERHLPHMISAVNAFKAKLDVWTTHLNNGRLAHFPNLEKMSQAIAFHTALCSPGQSGNRVQLAFW